MRFCLMIEGQENVTWDNWRAIAAATEEAGLEALFRSDHYLSVQGDPERGSLDAWATLAALAAVTSRIKLGTLVSPVTFRHPSVLAKNVVTVDHVSGGRVEVGMGAGWHVAEHRAFGFPFPDTRTRMDMLEEQLEIVNGEWVEGAFSFDGRHYRLETVDALPKPVQRPRPNLIVGGGAGPRSAMLAARFADEYNTFMVSPEEFARRRGNVLRACEAVGREPLTLSLMTPVLVGRDSSEYEERRVRMAERRNESGFAPSAEWIAGTVEEAAETLRTYEEAGVERVMFQQLLHDDLDMIDVIGRKLAPLFA
ncbi:MAG TPA: TIGR03560 family F420-dependent LLM class oxidoreductase [Thermoleophilaceae bacterium]